jgi:hypothetical protein
VHSAQRSSSITSIDTTAIANATTTATTTITVVMLLLLLILLLPLPLPLTHQILDEENESLREIMSRGGGASGLTNMARVADNGMKQYRRTRPDASKRAIERSKALERAVIHPLLLRHATRGMVSADGAAQRSAYLKVRACVCLVHVGL